MKRYVQTSLRRIKQFTWIFEKVNVFSNDKLAVLSPLLMVVVISVMVVMAFIPFLTILQKPSKVETPIRMPILGLSSVSDEQNQICV